MDTAQRTPAWHAALAARKAARAAARPALVEGPTADGGYNGYAYAKDGTRRLVHIPAR